MIDEGYIKYQCHWQNIPAIASEEIIELNNWRDRLYQLNLIGEYDNGIGFGNLSKRLPNSRELIISGTQTEELLTWKRNTTQKWLIMTGSKIM